MTIRDACGYVVVLVVAACTPPGDESVGQTREAEKRGSLGRWSLVASLPAPVANNATAAVDLPDGAVVFSFLGLDTTKAHGGITRGAFAYDVSKDAWRELAPVPGSEGRLAATAVGFAGRALVFGGYTVADDGTEVSTPNVDIYDPLTDSWSAGAPFPLPVDDAVSGVWRDSLVFIVSGWSQRDNVGAVQIYSPRDDRWRAATPISGPRVFGHAGSVLGDVIVYCDGVRVDPSSVPRFVMSEACYRGDIQPTAPERIDWRELARHPGPPRYRMAAGALPDAGLVVFAGGSDNPYNYDGIGYDGVPSAPSSHVFAYDVRNDRWVELSEQPVATMDHRDLAAVGRSLYLIGGMVAGQEVTARVQRLDLGP